MSLKIDKMLIKIDWNQHTLKIIVNELEIKEIKRTINSRWITTYNSS